ncbi:rhamnogalacturonan lyase [Pelagicoccus sp. SDUM812003]|uniref:rhamnogalacturonan lyase n=1 Tax=Pelagicoccus sp. SDUM812003 TaxID=3041267 RepID=UPI00280C8311|nr:rhamnogalacturonan lyase [Pelagicoccus sp. SDUM812003]MDQ8204371.1 rhamnogalacturonan lyase [Pelagicoccus sp. SDUM812003]
MSRKLISFSLVLCLSSMVTLVAAPRMERLDRGLVAVQQADGSVFVTWRLLGDEDAATAFNLYRETAAAKVSTDWGDYASLPELETGVTRLNEEPLAGPTWFVDHGAELFRETSYFVRPVLGGKEGEASKRFAIKPGSLPLPYHRVPIQTPAGYTPNDASIGDLDGDGDYEIVLKQEGRAHDNSRRGVTDPVFLQAYSLEGQLLWQIDLGINIRAGAHYTQFMVYDFDGDGKAEVACKTADGSRDALGTVIGDADADWRNDAGYIIRGPEFLTIFEGETGRALSTAPYEPSRHPTVDDPSPEQMEAVWGDGYGNRMDRFLAGVAYLDGETPSLIMCRGYYTRTVVVAWDWKNGELTKRWLFDSDATAENRPYRGQGDHSLSIADVDADGKQEIIYGSMVLDHDGAGLYSTGWGHGDALHVTDHVPSNPGLEVFNIQERFDQQGMNMRDAATGEAIFTVPSVKPAEYGGDRGEGPGRGIAVNMDPRFPGSESWAAGAGMSKVFSAVGDWIYDKPAGIPTNFAVWWDGDLQRELLDRNFILKFNPQTEQLDRLLTAHGSESNNGTKATPTLSGDIWGDWREEVIWRSRDNSELRIYTSAVPTRHRMPTLLHDAQYRVALAWQNVAYNQPPHPSFYLGDEAPLPERNRVEVVAEK